MQSKAFDEKTQQALRAYVYLLQDPRDEAVFYVGKGNENRVFDHVAGALNEVDRDSLKMDRISAILKEGLEPKHLILRHDLTDSEAFHVEAALIDYLRFSASGVTNIQSGRGAVIQGLMSVDEIQARYNATPLTYLGSDCVIININRSYRRFSEEDAVYKATKEIWKMADPKKRGIRFVLSEYRGLIVEVFEVEKWYTKPRQYGSMAKKAGQTYDGWGFNGHVADDSVRSQYVHTSTSHLKEKGSANVVRYRL